MLPTARVRALLQARGTISDTEADALQAALRELARVVVDAYKTSRTAAVPFQDALVRLPGDDRDELSERAAILEFEGGLTRDGAERAAIGLRYRHDGWRDRP